MEKPVYILGIESSGAASGISLSKKGELFADETFVVKNIHSRLLAGITEQILEVSQLNYKELTAIALSAGPGSFTGLRIGFSLAKGLAHALSRPVIQVPTLDIFAYQHGETERPVLSLIDAHRKEVFCAKYWWEDHRFLQLEESQLRPLNSLTSIINEPTYFVGSGAVKLEETIKTICGTQAIFPNPFHPLSESWALHHLAYQKFLGNEFVAAKDCQPLYLRSFMGVM